MASARTGRACRARRCCARSRCSRAAATCPASEEIVGGAEAGRPAPVLARRDAVVNHLDDSSQVDWALGVGIDVVRGYGRLSGGARGDGDRPGRHRADADRPARGGARHRQLAGDPAGAGTGRGPAVDLARRHQPARDPAADGRGRRRRGGLRVGDLAARAGGRGDHRRRGRIGAAGQERAVRRRDRPARRSRKPASPSAPEPGSPRRTGRRSTTLRSGTGTAAR